MIVNIAVGQNYKEELARETEDKVTLNEERQKRERERERDNQSSGGYRKPDDWLSLDLKKRKEKKKKMPTKQTKTRDNLRHFKFLFISCCEAQQRNHIPSS